MRTIMGALMAGVLALLLSGCASSGLSDSQFAEKYKDAVVSLPHVASVDSEYKTTAGMGATGHVYITADTSDDQELLTLLRSAFPAIVRAADGDPQASLDILISPSDGGMALGPQSLGYAGGRELTGYREFLKSHPDL